MLLYPLIWLFRRAGKGKEVPSQGQAAQQAASEFEKWSPGSMLCLGFCYPGRAVLSNEDGLFRSELRCLRSHRKAEID